jgi:hypothetical protein
VAVDGTTVHETDGWHECKISTIFFEDDHIRRSYYVGRFDNSEDFGWHVWLSVGVSICNLVFFSSLRKINITFLKLLFEGISFTIGLRD